jgi:hypothetical protein
MSNTTGLGELGEWPRGSGRRGHDGEGLAEQDKLKAMAGTRATVRRSRSRGRMSARVRSRRRREELQWATVSRRGVRTLTEWGGDAIGGRCFDCMIWGEWAWTGSGRSRTCVRLAADSLLQSGRFLF